MEWGIWLPIKRLKIWRNRSNLCWQEMIRQRERLHIELILPKPISVVLFLDQTRFQGTLENLDKTNPAQRTLSHGHHMRRLSFLRRSKSWKTREFHLNFTWWRGDWWKMNFEDHFYHGGRPFPSAIERPHRKGRLTLECLLPGFMLASRICSIASLRPLPKANAAKKTQSPRRNAFAILQRKGRKRSS